MIDREHDLSLTRQADLLQLSRGSIYYVPVPVSPADVELMDRIDHLHTVYPFMGARMLRDRLKPMGYRVGRRHVSRLMEVMGIEALYRKKRTTRRNPEHPVFPYLLRGMIIDRPNQCGRRIFRTSRWSVDFCISLRLSIGQRVALWLGGYRTH